MIKKKQYYYFIISNFIIFSIFFLNFYIKNIIRNIFFNNKYIYVNNYINIVNVKNYGIIFGFFDYYNFYKNYFLIIVSLFIVLVFFYIIYFYIIELNLIFILLYSFIIGGLLSNILDRFYYNYVLDFIDFHINNIHIVIFNLADYFIILGYLFLFFYLKINN
ncbi:signal peptidase II [Candidatus Annandia pinicola]|uniref:signal peptidase II n=1 Tax=Candidatus Annandia pinicola TaxID=1345117 RepID=UPI001D02038F|nr:signal peptidase II [Candidatus Annandia pinicola]UDG80530.1 Lipoprotein signal peptidase [Candidatus Annandia pinicola]